MQNPRTFIERIGFVDAMAIWTDKNKISPYESTAWPVAPERGADDGLDAVFCIHAGFG